MMMMMMMNPSAVHNAMTALVSCERWQGFLFMSHFTECVYTVAFDHPVMDHWIGKALSHLIQNVGLGYNGPILSPGP